MNAVTGSPPTKTNATRERGEGANKKHSEVILHGQHATVNQLPLPAPETVKGRCLGVLLRGERITHLARTPGRALWRAAYTTEEHRQVYAAAGHLWRQAGCCIALSLFRIIGGRGV